MEIDYIDPQILLDKIQSLTSYKNRYKGNHKIKADGIKNYTEPEVIESFAKKGEVVDSFETGNQAIIQQGELGEVFSNIDTDDMNKEGMSSIDFNARIRVTEEASITAWETLTSAGVVPHRWSLLTRKKKRNSVSIQGLGRKEKVEIVAGKREHDKVASGGFMNGVKDLFSSKPKEEK